MIYCYFGGAGGGIAFFVFEGETGTTLRIIKTRSQKVFLGAFHIYMQSPGGG